MIKIEFSYVNKEKILIIGINEKGERKEIGHIFTPSGSGQPFINAIQICGFDEAFDLWGCGVFGDKATGKMKKDIQLIWFNDYDIMDRKEREKIKIGEKVSECNSYGNGIIIKNKMGKMEEKIFTEDITKDRFGIGEKDNVCHRCYNYPCSCEVNIKYENPYIVKREQDVKPNTKEDYDKLVKMKILNGLKKNGR